MSSPIIDRRRASIIIGGTLSHESRERLIDAILEDGTGPALRIYFAKVDDVIEAIKSTIAAKQPLSLADHRAREGQFATIEATCRKHNLSFRRHSFARARHEGEIQLHLPGVADLNVPATQSGKPYATSEQIREYASRRDLRALVDQMEAIFQPIPPLAAL